MPASKSWGNDITRICTWAQFTTPDGRPLYVYNLHLDHQSQPSREKSVALLRRRIEARDPKAPVIVTGDFNAGEKNPAVMAMLDGRILRENLHVERVTVDELLESARSQGIAEVGDIRWGILEPDGKFSFVRRDRAVDTQARTETGHGFTR